MKANSDIIRSAYIGMLLKNSIEEKNLTITEVAEKMGISQPALSRVLNGKVGGSDNFFRKVSKALKLSPTEIENVFKKGAIEEYKYNFGEDITERMSKKVLSPEEIDEIIMEVFGLSKEQFKKLVELAKTLKS